VIDGLRLLATPVPRVRFATIQSGFAIPRKSVFRQTDSLWKSYHGQYLKIIFSMAVPGWLVV
jgi:hypothetical protein